MAIELRPARGTELVRDQLREQFRNLSFQTQEQEDGFLTALGDLGIVFRARPSRIQLQGLASAIASDTTPTPLARSEVDALKFDNDDRDRILSVVNRATRAVVDENLNERFLFATGNVDQDRIVGGRVNDNFAPVPSVHRFFISAGLENFEQKNNPDMKVASGIRAFLNKDTALGLNLADKRVFVDTGVSVVNTGSRAPEAQNSFLHADFGMDNPGGVTADQKSTISITIGNVRYTSKTSDEAATIAAVVTGRTIASSRENVGSGENRVIGITSPLTSTAAGGGNPQLQRPGYAGYFVLENFMPEPDAALK
jgi:hypothetical protein